MQANVTLYDAEDTLRVMLDTDESVPDEQREEFERGLVAVQLAAVDKRDSVGAFLAHVERKLFIKAKVDGKTVELHGEIDQEIDRLRALKEQYQKTYDRVNRYVLDVILSQPRDARGDLRKLEGRSSILSAAACPESLEEAVDLDMLPTKFKRVTVQMPAPVWDELQFDRPDLIAGMKLKEVEPTRQAIKDAIKAGENISGAKMAARKYRVVRK